MGQKCITSISSSPWTRLYIFDATITTNANITVWGVPDPSTGKLPVIQPDVLADNSIPGVLFTVNGNGLSATLQNLYLLGIAVNNVVNYGSGQAVQISGDNVRFAANNVVFEQWSQFAVGYAGNLDKFFMTNCKFRNMTTEPNQWYVGEVLRNENYIGAFKTDSIVITNSTMLFVSGYATAATGGIVNYYNFSHNNVVYTFKNPFFLDRMVNAKFDNNIFYAAYAGGENKTGTQAGIRLTRTPVRRSSRWDCSIRPQRPFCSVMLRPEKGTPQPNC